MWQLNVVPGRELLKLCTIASLNHKGHKSTAKHGPSIVSKRFYPIFESYAMNELNAEQVQAGAKGKLRMLQDALTYKLPSVSIFL